MKEIPWTLHPTIEARKSDFNKLLNALMMKYNIQDRNKLKIVIDGAARIYYGRDPLDTRDLRTLLRCVPKIREVLSRPENDARIADGLLDRDNHLISGGTWNYKRRVAIQLWLDKIKAGISDLEKVLSELNRARPKHRRGDVKFHGMVATIERYWEGLPDKKLRKTFTPKDTRQKRRLAMSTAMQFVEDIVEFIDPNAIKRIPSASRHRLKRIAK